MTRSLLPCCGATGGRVPWVDAERAGSYRYSQRAYLGPGVPAGAPVLLLDPVGIEDFSGLALVLAGEEWVMQAAHNDLGVPCRDRPRADPAVRHRTRSPVARPAKVGLASLVESHLGYEMRKGHGQADWSSRPLRRSWLSTRFSM